MHEGLVAMVSSGYCNKMLIGGYSAYDIIHCYAFYKKLSSRALSYNNDISSLNQSLI